MSCHPAEPISIPRTLLSAAINSIPLARLQSFPPLLDFACSR